MNNNNQSRHFYAKINIVGKVDIAKVLKRPPYLQNMKLVPKGLIKKLTSQSYPLCRFSALLLTQPGIPVMTFAAAST